MSMRRFTIPPNKPFFIFDTYGDWLAVAWDGALFDTRGEYIGFYRGEEHEVFTASGEWIGNLFSDGRVVRKRSAPKRPLLHDLPPRRPKPERFPARSPLPPQNAELGFDKIDVLEEDPEIFKRISDLTPDAD